MGYKYMQKGLHMSNLIISQKLGVKIQNKSVIPAPAVV